MVDGLGKKNSCNGNSLMQDDPFFHIFGTEDAEKNHGMCQVSCRVENNLED